MNATIQVCRRAHRIEAYEASTHTWLGEVQLADGCSLDPSVVADLARALTTYLEANGYVPQVCEEE